VSPKNKGDVKRKIKTDCFCHDAHTARCGASRAVVGERDDRATRALATAVASPRHVRATETYFVSVFTITVCHSNGT